MLQQVPSILRRRDVALSVERDLDVGVSVEPFDQGSDAGDATGGTAGENGGDG